MESTNANDQLASTLRTSVKEGEAQVKQVVADLEQQLKEKQEQLKKVVAGVDKQLRDNPWPIVAGVAVGCVLLGFMMGSNKRN